MRSFRWGMICLFCLAPRSWADTSPPAAPAKTPVTCRVGVCDLSPLSAFDKTGKARGFFIDLLSEIAQKEQWTLEFVPVSSAKGPDLLRTGKLDLVAAIPLTRDKAGMLDFNQEKVISTWAEVYVHRKTDVQSMLDLAGQSIGVVQDDAYAAELRAITQRLNIDCQFVEFKNYDEVSAALAKRWIGAGILDRLYGLLHEKEYFIQRTPIIFSAKEYRFMAAKGDPRRFLSSIDYQLRAMKEDSLSAYYRLAPKPEKDYQIPPAFKGILFGAVGAFVIAGITAAILRRKVRMQTSELFRQNQALRESEARFRRTFETANEGIWGLDNEFRTTFVNAKMAEILGGKVEDLIGKSITDFVFETDRAEHESQLDIRRRGQSSVYERRLRRLDGNEVWTIVSATPVFDDHRQFLGSFCMFTDINDRKKVEREIRQLNDELELRVKDRTVRYELVNKELEAFAYSVSHDLRAPLRTISGFSQILLEEYSARLEENGKRNLERVHGAAKKMSQLIDAMLMLSRLTQQKMELGPVDLSRLAMEISNELRETNPARPVEFVIAQGVVAEGDERLLLIVLQNLLNNAWKFTRNREGARIEFGMSENGKKSFFVRDNGAGFDMRYANKLFGTFQRLHSEAEFEGTGIGLATIQRIIRRHDGQVWAEGDVGKGATFSFSLPAPVGLGKK